MDSTTFVVVTDAAGNTAIAGTPAVSRGKEEAVGVGGQLDEKSMPGWRKWFLAIIVSEVPEHDHLLHPAEHHHAVHHGRRRQIAAGAARPVVPGVASGAGQ